MDQVLIDPDHPSEQLNAHVAVGHLVGGELLDCFVVHVELMLLKERDRALIDHHLCQHRQLFPVKEVLLRTFDVVLKINFVLLDLVLVPEDGAERCLTVRQLHQFFFILLVLVLAGLLLFNQLSAASHAVLYRLNIKHLILEPLPYLDKRVDNLKLKVIKVFL